MINAGQFVETQHWPRLITWPVVTAGGLSVAAFAFGEAVWPLREISQVLAVVSIPLGWILLEWMGPTIEVSRGMLRYSIWPFYRKEIDLSQLKSCKSKTFHPGSTGKYTIPDRHYIELWLTDGRVIVVTTEHPERLAEAIRRESAKQQEWRQGAVLV